MSSVSRIGEHVGATCLQTPGEMYADTREMGRRILYFIFRSGKQGSCSARVPTWPRGRRLEHALLPATGARSLDFKQRAQEEGAKPCFNDLEVYFITVPV
ncbi:hypothetical protein MRX96_023365 [Rhipicephalus microplus]